MDQFEVFLASHVSDPDGPCVAFSPVDKGWNDFGFNFHAAARFADHGRDPLMLRVFVIPQSDSMDRASQIFSNWYDQVRRSEPDGRIAPAKLHGDSAILTLLADEEGYKKLREWCRTDADYYDALSSINDITYLPSRGDFERSIYNAVIRSERFRLGVIRSAYAYRAFRSGFSSAFAGNNEISDSRNDFEIIAKLDGFKNEHHLSIVFNSKSLISDRMHCLIGKNGAGKSRLLVEFTNQLIRSRVKEEIVVLAQFDEELRPDIGPKFNRLLCYTTEAESAFPEPQSEQALDYRCFNLALGGGDGSSTMAVMLSDLLRDSQISDDALAKFPRYHLFKRFIGRHLDFSYICIPVNGVSLGPSVFLDDAGQTWARFENIEWGNEQRRLELLGAIDDVREISYFAANNGRVKLSSGQRLFLRFAIHFLSYASIGSLVIIDEPETHLHPNLVSEFSVLIQEVLSATKSIALVATHSAFVAREVPTACNHIISVDDGEVTVRPTYLRTLGASPTALSLAIFGDDTATRYHDIIAKEIASSGRTLEEVIADFGLHVSDDMLSSIRFQMESQSAGADSGQEEES